MNNISQDQFQQQLGSDFWLLDSSSASLTLLELTTPARVPEGFESFALVFSAQGPILDQDVYQLGHPELEPLELFLVPIEKKGETVYYESVFNRPV